MDELTSTEFRKRYASLRDPVVVTVNGHAIGKWTPMQPVEVFAHQMGKVADAAHEVARVTAQQRRDNLLNRINRSK